MLKYHLGLLLIILTVFMIACQNNQSNKPLGVEAIYLQNCSLCHGKDGKLGASGAKDLTASTLDLESTLLFIKKGSPQKGMVAYEHRLSELELKMLSEYVMSLHQNN